MCVTWDVLEIACLKTMTYHHTGCHAEWDILLRSFWHLGCIALERFSTFPFCAVNFVAKLTHAI